MTRLLALLVALAAFATPRVLGDGGVGPGPPARDTGPAAALPVGKWEVQFANGVKEVCTVGNGGEATVEEPRRRANGLAEARDGSVVITWNDDRVERWTPVGTRFVVEHWFPASRVPVVAPVLGIAEATR
jgi:hypothetical protein